MPYSPIKVANEFLRVASGSEPSQRLTPLQLIKLVYIAHGWSLHFYRRPLVNEPVQAWQYGPVIPTLYNAIKEYRASPVSARIAGDADPQQLDVEDQRLIEAVFRAYGHLSGTQLSNMTHVANSPWSSIWMSRGRNAVIPNDVIADHYSMLAARRVQDSASNGASNQ